MTNQTSTRRKFVALTGVATIGSTAGCSSDETNPESTSDEDVDTGSDDDTATNNENENTETETIFDVRSHERESEEFPAQEGDKISVNVKNISGFRTHTVVRSADKLDDIGVILSEGVQNKNEFQVTVEQDAIYIIEMTPHDETRDTVGKVKATLTPVEVTSKKDTTSEEKQLVPSESSAELIPPAEDIAKDWEEDIIRDTAADETDVAADYRDTDGSVVSQLKMTSHDSVDGAKNLHQEVINRVRSTENVEVVEFHPDDDSDEGVTFEDGSDVYRQSRFRNINFQIINKNSTTRELVHSAVIDHLEDMINE